MAGISASSGQQERQRAANATGHGDLTIEIDPMAEQGQQNSLHSERRPIDDVLGVNGASERSDGMTCPSLCRLRSNKLSRRGRQMGSSRQRA